MTCGASPGRSRTCPAGALESVLIESQGRGDGRVADVRVEPMRLPKLQIWMLMAAVAGIMLVLGLAANFPNGRRYVALAILVAPGFVIMGAIMYLAVSGILALIEWASRPDKPE